MSLPLPRPLIAVLAFALTMLAASPSQAATTYLTSFGSTSTTPSNPYPLSNPTGVAVNSSTGDVYVADTGNNRIERFDSAGNLVGMWGRGVNQSTGGDVCPEAPGDTCQPGAAGDAAGWFDSPEGIGVDNSTGPAAGSVYVLDTDNHRVQRFTAGGDFVLMWGKAVDQQSAGNVCPEAPGDTCQAGLQSGSEGDLGLGTPNIPSEDGVFGGWTHDGLQGGLQLATDPHGYVYVSDTEYRAQLVLGRIQKFDAEGQYLGKVNPSGITFITQTASPTVGPNGDVYVVTRANQGNGEGAFAAQFDGSDFSLAGDAPYRLSYGVSKSTPRVVADPTNGYLLTLAGDCATTPSLPGTHIVEYQPATTQEVDCTIPGSPAVDLRGAMAVSGVSHKLYITNPGANDVQVFQPPVAEPPEVTGQSAAEVTARGARIDADVTANLDETTFHVEYGTRPCSEIPDPCASTPESASVGAALTAKPGSTQVNGLTPDTTYYYRVVATNGVGSDKGPDRRFTTFASPLFDPSCSNNLARQQTGAAFLLDCRAYELVSAEDQGGYDVESDLVPGQVPYGGFPRADGRALYAVHNGGIPGAGNPTNRGPDPYVAIRDEADRRWRSEYVGVPAYAPSAFPFSSTVAGADSSLDSFAFGGPEICAPCFADGSSGIPLRRPDGSLIQGMAGSIVVPSPAPAGEVIKPLSADGTHFVFGSKQKFVAGANSSGADATIYDRNLTTGKTQVVSLDHGAPIENGDGVAELDISKDGSRILIGKLVSEAGGVRYWHLFMHVGSSVTTIDLMPGAGQGALYDGMSEDGTKVYFTTGEALPTAADSDTDSSADIYRATVATSSSTLSRVSAKPGEGPGGTGDTDACDPGGNSYNNADWNVAPGGPTDCSAVAIAGGGGVASGAGTIYFLSPEQLDGSKGEAGAPNLFYAKPGQAPKFVTTLESGAHQPLKPKEHRFQRSVGPFSYPEGVAIDNATGSTYVLDTLATSGPDKEGNYSPGAFVQKFDAGGETDLAFGDNSKLDGSNTLKGAFLESGSGFNGSPVGLATQIAVDNSNSTSKGDLYVPDFAPSHAVIDKFSPTGHYLTGIALTADVPSGVAVNQANGRVYVTGGFSSTVHTYDSNGNPVAPTSFNVTGPALGLAVDSAGNSYVVNGKETRTYNPAGAFVKVFDPNPSYGIAIDASDGHVYVDEGSQVVEYDAAGNVLETIQLGFAAKSVSLAVDSGRLAISVPGRGNVAFYTAKLVPPDSGYDNPLPIDSVSRPETLDTADFQTNSSGEQAVFPSAMPIGGFDNNGRYEVFRFDASSGAQPRCISCNPTEVPPSSDSSLASNGLSLTDDGRVFFNSGEPLVLRDANNREDVYEWSAAADRAELISSGLGRFDSSLLSASADGTDAFFFTREKLAENDDNGNLVRLYDARVGGGFFVIPPPPQCKASDECHGAGTPSPPSPSINTIAGSGGNTPAPKAKRCTRGKVRRHGRCVKSHRAHKRRSHHAKHAGSGR